MAYKFGDHPTKKELLFREVRTREGEREWKERQKEWFAKAEMLTLKDAVGNPFWFVITPFLLNLITKISRGRGFLEAASISSRARKNLQAQALNYEAYYSSHIEGAQSSLEEALRFIKKKQKSSRDESLQMIVNNKLALEYASKQSGKPVTKELVCRLQHILTENTHLDRPITRGDYRKGPVYILNGLGHVVYEGPPYQKVPEMMNGFIKWINEEGAIDPLIKAGIVHLYFVHIHPFDDGNGRTARALSNLILADSGLKFIDLLSLSSYFDHRRQLYYSAIQAAREHANDLTYFLIFYLEALLSKLEEVKKEMVLDKNIANLKDLISESSYQELNHRQIKALRLMLLNNEKVTTKKYCKFNKCSDETARKDFSILLDLELISAIGEGRSRGYILSDKNRSK